MAVCMQSHEPCMQITDNTKLNILYSKGLEEITELNIHYYFDGKMYWGTLGSKGSFVAIHIAYPIQVFAKNPS